MLFLSVVVFGSARALTSANHDGGCALQDVEDQRQILDQVSSNDTNSFAELGGLQHCKVGQKGEQVGTAELGECLAAGVKGEVWSDARNEGRVVKIVFPNGLYPTPAGDECNFGKLAYKRDNERFVNCLEEGAFIPVHPWFTLGDKINALMYTVWTKAPGTELASLLRLTDGKEHEDRFEILPNLDTVVGAVNELFTVIDTLQKEDSNGIRLFHRDLNLGNLFIRSFYDNVRLTAIDYGPDACFMCCSNIACVNTKSAKAHKVVELCPDAPFQGQEAAYLINLFPSLLSGAVPAALIRAVQPSEQVPAGTDLERAIVLVKDLKASSVVTSPGKIGPPSAYVLQQNGHLCRGLVDKPLFVSEGPHSFGASDWESWWSFSMNSYALVQDGPEKPMGSLLPLLVEFLDITCQASPADKQGPSSAWKKVRALGRPFRALNRGLKRAQTSDSKRSQDRVLKDRKQDAFAFGAFINTRYQEDWNNPNPQFSESAKLLFSVLIKMASSFVVNDMEKFLQWPPMGKGLFPPVPP